MSVLRYHTKCQPELSWVVPKRGTMSLSGSGPVL